MTSDVESAVALPTPAADGAAGPELRLEGVRKTFGEVVAIDNLTLEVGAGEFFALLGPSGSGKTTCLRIVAGFEQPTSGTVSLAGSEVTDVPPFRRAVNTVFQDYALFPHMSVADNVGYGLRVRRVPKAQRHDAVTQALRTVRLEGMEERRPSQLSGGQRQRVALARAIVNRPRVLLLDEPLGALDRKLREQMQVELKQLQRELGITFLFVTHDQDEALSMSDRIAVFNAGRVEQVGTPSDVYDRPSTPFVADFIGTSNIVEGAAAVAVMGADGIFSLRPERIRIAPAAAPVGGGERHADATVVDVVHAGATSRWVVSLDAGPAWIVTAPADAAIASTGRSRGDKVCLIWDDSSVYRLT